MHDVGLRAFLDGLTHAVRQQRLIFAQKAADDQETVSRIDLRNRHTQPRGTGLFAVRAEVGLAQT